MAILWYTRFQQQEIRYKRTTTFHRSTALRNLPSNIIHLLYERNCWIASIFLKLVYGLGTRFQNSTWYTEHEAVILRVVSHVNFFFIRSSKCISWIFLYLELTFSIFMPVFTFSCIFLAIVFMLNAFILSFVCICITLMQ